MNYENKYSPKIAQFLNTKNLRFLQKEAHDGLRITQNDYSPLFIKLLFKGSLEHIETEGIQILFQLNAHNPSLNPFSKTPLLASYFISYNLKREFGTYLHQDNGDKIFKFIENLSKQRSQFHMQDKDLKSAIIALSMQLGEDDRTNQKINQVLQHYYLITENKDTFKQVFQKLFRLREYHHMVNYLMPFIEKEKLESLLLESTHGETSVSNSALQKKRNKI